LPWLEQPQLGDRHRQRESALTLTADERKTMTRQFLLETDLDAETRSKIHCIAFVLEHDAKESGDPDVDDVDIATC
jgi:hypothetical protein